MGSMICWFCGSEHGVQEACVPTEGKEFPPADLEPAIGLIGINDPPPPLPPPRTASLPIRMTILGKEERKASVVELTRGGAQVATDRDLPAVGLRVELFFDIDGRGMKVNTEVISHAPPGFRVRFVGVPAAWVEALVLAAAGLTSAPPAAAPAPYQVHFTPPATVMSFSRSGAIAPAEVPAGKKPAITAPMLTIEPGAGPTHYQLLGLALDAGCAEASSRADAEGARLQAAIARGDDPAQAEATLQKVQVAGVVLSSPARRARYDAEIGNFRGVARCLASGLTAQVAEAMRREFLTRHPGNELRAQTFMQGAHRENKEGRADAGQALFQQALMLDPLNLTLLRSMAQPANASPRARSVVLRQSARAIPTYPLRQLATRLAASSLETFSREQAWCWLVWEGGVWYPAVASRATLVPQDPKGTAPSIASGDPVAFALSVAGAQMGQVALGRSPSCDIELNEATLSLFHLVFMTAGDLRWTLRDVGSKNGTTLDGRKVEPYLPSPLRDGAQIVAGTVKLTFYEPTGMHARLRKTVTA